MIDAQQFLHDGGPQGRGTLNGQGVPHGLVVGISNPYCHGVLLVEANRPSISKTTAGTGFYGDSLAESQR